MIGFYKHYIEEITEKSVNPDRRRYIDPEEACRHYIDLEYYGDSIPQYLDEAIKKYTEDSIKSWGMIPWHIQKMKNYLTRAFLDQNVSQIIRLSIDLGHYIADAHVPLHTTINYNGQLTGQYGIHGFWETRLPELFFQEYDLFTGSAEYIDNTQQEIWKVIHSSHSAVDSVLTIEKKLSKSMGKNKFSIEEKNGISTKVYSKSFSTEYHGHLNGMVQRKMKESIKMIGSFWYTCWVDGGQPDLNKLIKVEVSFPKEITNEEKSAKRLHE
jgi:hypothetical protein